MAAMKLIDVDALRADYGMAEDCKNCKTGYRSCEYDRIYSKMDFCGWLDDAPTVDALEVVRCKDCKYFDSGTDEDGKLFFKCLGWVYGGTSEDDFCSHGERKDGGDGKTKKPE